MEEALVAELRRLEFSEKEAKVYIAAMKLGTSTMQKIAKLSGVNRATTYVAVEALMHRGLMSSVTKGKKRYFTVEDPDKIQSVLEKERLELAEKEKTVESVMPKLTEMFAVTHGAGQKPQVRFYEGMEGLNIVREEILKRKDTDSYNIYNKKYFLEVFPEKDQEVFIKKIDSKKRKGTSILASNTGIYNVEARGIKRYVIDEKLYDHPIDFCVFDNKVSITKLDNNPISIIIENETIAEAMKSILKLVVKK